MSEVEQPAPAAPPPPPPPDVPLGPWTVIFMVMNVAVFSAIAWAGGLEATSDFFWLVGMGAKHNASIHAGEWWRLVTCCFLHIGWVHLVMNMLALADLGAVIEAILGGRMFQFVYVFSGIGASMLSFKMSETLSAGASGAIFGLLGAALIVGCVAHDRVPPPLRTRVGRGVAPLVLTNVVLGANLSSYLDNWAHLGGFLAGAALALPIAVLLRWPGLYNALSWIAGPLALCALVVAGGPAWQHVPKGRALVENIQFERDILNDWRAYWKEHAPKLAALEKMTRKLSDPEAIKIRDSVLELVRLRKRLRERIAAMPMPARDPETTKLAEDLKKRFADPPELEKRLAAIKPEGASAALEKEFENEADWKSLLDLTPVINATQAWVAHTIKTHHIGK